MVYVDKNGNEIKNPDLTRGYLVDSEWITHPAKRREGHYEYRKMPGGGVVQTYVVDREGTQAWREVTVQTYIPFGEILGNTGASESNALEIRVAALEEKVNGYEAAYAQGVMNA